jgi:hypothetical protein
MTAAKALIHMPCAWCARRVSGLGDLVLSRTAVDYEERRAVCYTGNRATGRMRPRIKSPLHRVSGRCRACPEVMSSVGKCELTCGDA